MRKTLFLLVLVCFSTILNSCGKSHPEYVFVPGNSLMSGHPVRWEIAVQAVREYNMQFGMSYEEANKKAEAEVATYKPAEKQ